MNPLRVPLCHPLSSLRYPPASSKFNTCQLPPHILHLQFHTMANNENSPPPTPTSPSTRRASFSAGQKLSGLFGRSPPNSNGTSAYPGPIATAAANAQAQQRRRTSVASLGLSGSPTQTSAFAGLRNRQGSGSGSSTTTSINENAIEEGDAEPNASPTSPSAFARRMSFGARALRDVKIGNGNANNTASAGLSSSHPKFGLFQAYHANDFRLL